MFILGHISSEDLVCKLNEGRGYDLCSSMAQYMGHTMCSVLTIYLSGWWSE